VLGFTDVYFMKYSLVADHYQHLALIGVVALAGAAWATALPGRWRLPLAAAVLAGLGGLTWCQARTYRDSETLYRSILARNPDAWIAHNNLVNILNGGNRLPEAVEQLREALRLRPQDARNWNNLGVALARLGRNAEAVAPYREAVRLEPDSVEFNYNLGLDLRQLGRNEEAIPYFRTVVQLRPYFAQGHLALSLALWDAGQREEAVAERNRSIALQPMVPDISARGE
jgi:Flp pilus assembly protein TadD